MIFEAIVTEIFIKDGKIYNVLEGNGIRIEVEGEKCRIKEKVRIEIMED